MHVLAFSITVVLCFIAILHALWGIGIWWPVSNEQDLARTVVGAPGIVHMPGPTPCFMVASALCVNAMIVILMGRLVTIDWIPAWMIGLSGFIAASVFTLRGIIGYTPFWARITPEAPFRSYDLWYYSPLCLALGVGMFGLVYSFFQRSG
ncbi:MAG: DUF3995 domain-containing protein [Pseudomonadota bacterium]